MPRENRALSIVQLPAALPIGFTGHRSLPDEAKSREAIRGVLREMKSSIPAEIYGVSSAASGGDLLFAEACIELGIPLRVLLQAPRERFREDFDKIAWLRAEQVLEKAMSVEVIEAGDSGDERYYHCSIETVRQSRLMIALWDGELSRGIGGTADTVCFAERLGRPVIWIHSETGSVENRNVAATEKLLHDPELEFLNRLPDAGIVVHANSPKELAQAWFRKVDANATRFAPQVRRLASVPILYTAAAAVISGAARGTTGGIWLVVSAAMGITSTILPKILQLKQRQDKWARTRIAAEVGRSVIALWNTPCSFEVVRPDTLPELSGTLIALNRLKMLDGLQNRLSVHDFKQDYGKGRLDDQIKYFRGQMERAARHARIFKVVSLVCAASAVAIAIGLALSMMKTFGELSRDSTRWLGLAVSALFQIATVSGALLILNDATRRHRRYQQIHGWLIELSRQFDVVSTWHSVLGVVDRIERILLVELIEWKALTQNIDLPRR